MQNLFFANLRPNDEVKLKDLKVKFESLGVKPQKS